LIESKQELIDFLKERTFLKVLDERVIHGIEKLFQFIACGPGQIVLREGDEPDSIYIITDGSVEVIQGQKVVAYLTSGDCFGEMALLNDTTRNATIRVPEEAEILQLPRKALQELQNYFPEVRRELKRLAERRTSGALTTATSPGLQGNLAFFDLPTVIQTVTGSKQTGILSLRGRGSKLVAEVHVRQGRLIHASYGHLNGEYALWELLTRGDPLDFSFEQHRELDSSTVIDKLLSSRDATMILIEGARRADELPRLTQTLEWPDKVFQIKSPQPDWSSINTDWAPIGRKLWLLLEVGLSVRQLTEKIAYDRYTVLSALDEMIKAKLLGRAGMSESRIIASAHTPAQVASMVSALNQITLNLSAILGKDKVHDILSRALAESVVRYNNLSSLKIHPDNAALDLRLAAPDVSQSQASLRSVRELTYTFLKLAAQSDYQEES